jgi:alpha-1,2-mannosyltransferase
LRPRGRLAVVLLVAILSSALASRLAVRHGDFDLRVYRGAVASWLDGGSLYGFGLGSRHLGFTYPPFAAICMAPMALLPLGTVTLLNKLVVVAAVIVTTSLVVRNLPRLRHHSQVFVVALLVPMVFLLQPVRDTLSFGQVNILLAALVLLDLRSLQCGGRWSGVGIGLATAIKLTPGLFIVFLLVAGARRAAGTAVATAVAATLVAGAVSPSTSWTYWSAVIFDSGRVGSIDSATNQSLAGVLARLANSSHAPATWFPLIVLLLAWSLRSARSLWRREEPLAAFTVIGLTAVLSSPISWVHHLWWVLPGLLLVLDSGLRRNSRALVALSAGLGCLYASGLPDLARAPAGQHHTWLALLGENAYAVGCLGLVLVLPLLRGDARTAAELVATS